jgi:hypothetical protein
MDYNGYGCIFIFVLTHGGKGGILFANDKPYIERELWTPISNSDKLKGLPKIFITQVSNTHKQKKKKKKNDMSFV